MTRRANLVAISCLLAFAHPAQAFDCVKASTPVEKAICSDAALKGLADSLGAAYAEVKAASTAAEQKMLARSQKRWISSREQCPDAIEGLSACVRNATEERLRLFTGAPESGPGVEGRIVPVFIVQDGTVKAYDLDISVLRFAEPKTPGQKKLNAIVNHIIGQVKLGPHGQDTVGVVYAQQDGLSVSYASPQMMSVQHSFWSDEGGAHGSGGIENFNIDMKSGKLVEIGNFLPETAAAKLAADCKIQIVTQKREHLDGEPYDPATDDFLKDDVINEHIATLSRWTIKAEQITITFDAYAIGSYAEGTYECRFPTAKVKAMALSGALLP